MAQNPNAYPNRNVLAYIAAGIGGLATLAALGAGVIGFSRIRTDQYREMARSWQQEVTALQDDTRYRILTHQPVQFQAGLLVCENNRDPSASYDVENPLLAVREGVLLYGYVRTDPSATGGIDVKFFTQGSADGSTTCTMEPDPASVLGTNTVYDADMQVPDGAPDGMYLTAKDPNSPASHTLKGAGSDGTYTNRDDYPAPIGFEFTPKK